MSTGDEPPAHEDILQLLQVQSVVKKVPSELTNVRRIVQYAKDPDDDGSIQDLLGAATPFEAYFIWATLLVTALVIVFLLAYRVRPTATEGGGNEAGDASKPLLVPTRGGEEAIQLDFDDGSSKNSFMESIMKTLKSLEE